LEQLERSKRFLERIKDIYAGRLLPSHTAAESCDDDVISFFIHCHHIGDWIIQLNKLGVSKKHVNDFIDCHTPLKICADFANGAKHCKLTMRKRTGRQPHIIRVERRSSAFKTSDNYIKSKYTITSQGEDYDALDLAEKCIDLWDQFCASLKTQQEI